MGTPAFTIDQGGLVITDRAGNIVYASDTLATRTGFRHPETIGARPGNLWGGAMPRDFYERMWGALLRGKTVVETLRNHKKNGEAYLEELSLAPLVDTLSLPTYFISVAPFHLSSSSRRSFQREFKTVFSPQEQVTTNLVAWLSRWLGGTGETEKLGKAGIEELLLEPTRELYQYREDDANLIRTAQADPSRFSPLYEKYFPLLERYFFARVSHDHDAALDLAQDVFTRAFEKLPAFHLENASFGTYLLRIAHNLLIDRYRKVSRMDTVRVAEYLGSAVTLPENTLEIDWTLLSPLDRELMELKYREGYSIREIALRTRLSENAVKLRLSRARKKLRNSH